MLYIELRLLNLLLDSRFITDKKQLQLPYEGNIWELRVQALYSKLSYEELAKVIYHISKHRGFKSSKKEVDNPENKELTKANADMQNVVEAFESSGYKTIAEYMLHTYKDTNIRNKFGSYSQLIKQELNECHVTQELADKIFEIFGKTNYFDDIQLTEFQRDYLLDLYTKSSQNDAIQEYVCNILKIYVQNSVEKEYDNRGKTLYEILRFFSSKGISDKSLIKEFKDFTRLQQLSKEHIVQLTTDYYPSIGKGSVSFSHSYFKFSQLDRSIRELVLKDISEEQILEIIQNTISLAKGLHSLEQRAISYLLIDLYLYRQVTFDIINPLWEYCDNSSNKLACQIISLYDSIYHNGEYTIVEMPNPNENTVYYLLNQIHNNIYSNEEKEKLIKLILNGYIHTTSITDSIIPGINTYIFLELFMM